MCDLGDRPVAVAQELDGALDPPFQDKLVWWLADRDLECLHKVVGAQSGNRGEFDRVPGLQCEDWGSSPAAISPVTR